MTTSMAYNGEMLNGDQHLTHLSVIDYDDVPLNE